MKEEEKDGWSGRGMMKEGENMGKGKWREREQEDGKRE